jgi:hypothetical protein
MAHALSATQLASRPGIAALLHTPLQLRKRTAPSALDVLHED